MWKIHNSTSIANQVQEEVLHLEEEEGEEDTRKFRIMTQKIHTFIANNMEEVITPKHAQKPKRT
jgi:hypothetical protein